MIEQTLQKLGWSDKQTHVYLTLLKNGPSSVRSLALAAGINRGTTYDILKNLRDLGCVAFYQKAAKQYFVAEDPAALRMVLDARATELHDAREQLDAVLPQLRSLRSSGEEQPVSLLYDGQAGVRQVLEDVLLRSSQAQEKMYYAYSAPDVRSYLYAAMPDFTKERLKRAVRVRVIGFGAGASLQGLDERRELTGVGMPMDTYVFMYAGRLAYITKSAAGEPVAMIIDNNGIYQTERQVFQALWERLAH